MTNYEVLMRDQNFKYPQCAQTLGAELVSYCPEDSVIEMSFQAGNEFTNPTGSIQGGFLCAMLDDCLGLGLYYSLEVGQFAPTIELKTQFIKGAKPGVLTGKARVISKGRQVCFLEGELYQNQALIAKATASVIIKQPIGTTS